MPASPAFLRLAEPLPGYEWQPFFMLLKDHNCHCNSLCQTSNLAPAPHSTPRTWHKRIGMTSEWKKMLGKAVLKVQAKASTRQTFCEESQMTAHVFLMNDMKEIQMEWTSWTLGGSIGPQPISQWHMNDKDCFSLFLPVYQGDFPQPNRPFVMVRNYKMTKVGCLP